MRIIIKIKTNPKNLVNRVNNIIPLPNTQNVRVKQPVNVNMVKTATANQNKIVDNFVTLIDELMFEIYGSYSYLNVF